MESDSLKNARVLVVEDDPGVARAWKRILESVGVDVKVTRRVGAARDIIRAGRIDFVLTDFRLAGEAETGLAVARCAAEAGIAVAICSGSFHQVDARARTELRAFTVLDKPVPFDVVRGHIERAIAARAPAG